MTTHTTKGTASAFWALHCDEQVKPGEFHLQKIPSVAPVVLSQVLCLKRKSFKTKGGSHPNEWQLWKDAVTLSEESVTISENKHMHTDFLNQRQKFLY